MNENVREFWDPDSSVEGQVPNENALKLKSRTRLVKDQESDVSLDQCRSLLHRGKGNLSLRNGVLMHVEKILGQNYQQLVVPKSRRKQCLEFGQIGGLMSPKKVSQRLRLNFW